jgi:hypothetical protein
LSSITFFALAMTASTFSRLRTIAGVGEEPAPIARSVGSDGFRREAVEGAPERLLLLQDRQPGKPGLVDLQCEALEQTVVAPDRKTVFALVVGP